MQLCLTPNLAATHVQSQTVHRVVEVVPLSINLGHVTPLVAARLLKILGGVPQVALCVSARPANIPPDRLCVAEKILRPET